MFKIIGLCVAIACAVGARTSHIAPGTSFAACGVCRGALAQCLGGAEVAGDAGNKRRRARTPCFVSLAVMYYEALTNLNSLFGMQFFLIMVHMCVQRAAAPAQWRAWRVGVPPCAPPACCHTLHLTACARAWPSLPPR